MIYWELFLAFLVPGIVGYGGGPASIPLIQIEVVERYGWLTVEEFAELLALGNALPGPIATKMAGYVGYAQGGVLGAVVALFATVAPSLLILIFLLQLLSRFKHSPKVKRMTGLIRPTIAILLGILALQFFTSSWEASGVVQTIIIAGFSFLLLEKWKLHPAYVICGALVYGAFILPLF
ncbi:chromate transporter [Caldalkalibacillus mannanilyticus]|uniref:chromate transporter n=1 Tax=Caldalkalibacillus mannanilyticus TaxID=1418 RepID=UPI0004698A70|nr:chromate transporter [Caldalkalibacillus mannanilyticus]